MDVTQALNMAAKVGHIKRPNGYRKFADITDSEKDIAELPCIEQIIEGGVPGLCEPDEEGNWVLREV